MSLTVTDNCPIQSTGLYFFKEHLWRQQDEQAASLLNLQEASKLGESLTPAAFKKALQQYFHITPIKEIVLFTAQSETITSTDAQFQEQLRNRKSHLSQFFDALALSNATSSAIPIRNFSVLTTNRFHSGKILLGLIGLETQRIAQLDVETEVNPLRLVQLDPSLFAATHAQSASSPDCQLGVTLHDAINPLQPSTEKTAQKIALPLVLKLDDQEFHFTEEMLDQARLDTSLTEIEIKQARNLVLLRELPIAFRETKKSNQVQDYMGKRVMPAKSSFSVGDIQLNPTSTLDQGIDLTQLKPVTPKSSFRSFFFSDQTHCLILSPPIHPFYEEISRSEDTLTNIFYTLGDSQEDFFLTKSLMELGDFKNRSMALESIVNTFFGHRVYIRFIPPSKKLLIGNRKHQININHSINNGPVCIPAGRRVSSELNDKKKYVYEPYQFRISTLSDKPQASDNYQVADEHLGKPGYWIKIELMKKPQDLPLTESITDFINAPINESTQQSQLQD